MPPGNVLETKSCLEKAAETGYQTILAGLKEESIWNASQSIKLAQLIRGGRKQLGLQMKGNQKHDLSPVRHWSRATEMPASSSTATLGVGVAKEA